MDIEMNTDKKLMKKDKNGIFKAMDNKWTLKWPSHKPQVCTVQRD